MRLHRVTWVDPGWVRLRTHEPFHPLHVALDRQSAGRWDNPSRYAALYCSTTDAAAVGETFANSARWLASEIVRQKEGRPRCLVRFEFDESRLVDLDDPAVLLRLGLRPTDVVRRNRDHTREIALRLWHDRDELGASGLRWWSYWRPEWTNVVLWTPSVDPPWFEECSEIEVEPLDPDHPAVRVAADVLPRRLG